MYRLKSITLILSIFFLFFSCSDNKAITNSGSESESSLQPLSLDPINQEPIMSNSGFWAGLDYKSFVQGTDDEKNVSTICQNEFREYRMEWVGSGQPDNFRWYITKKYEPIDPSSAHSMAKDMLFFSNSAPSNEFTIWAVAYDDGTPFNYQSKRGNVVELITCSPSYPDGPGEPCTGWTTWCPYSESCIGLFDDCSPPDSGLDSD